MVGDTKKSSEPRVVFIRKSQLELGVHLCGGNLHGVFVAEVEDDSPAKVPDGLVPGDLILEVSSELLSSRPGSSLSAFQASCILRWHRRWRSTASHLATLVSVECCQDPLGRSWEVGSAPA